MHRRKIYIVSLIILSAFLFGSGVLANTNKSSVDLAEENQKLTETVLKYEQMIQDLTIENNRLERYTDEYAKRNTELIKAQKDLVGRLNALCKENADLKMIIYKLQRSVKH